MEVEKITVLIARWSDKLKLNWSMFQVELIGQMLLSLFVKFIKFAKFADFNC